jgi:hypothetical protein
LPWQPGIPLGKHQLKIVEVIFALLTVSSETSDNELLKHSMDLFFEYPKIGNVLNFELEVKAMQPYQHLDPCIRSIIAEKATKLIAHFGLWDLFFEEALVQRIQQEARSRCSLHLPCSLFGFSIHQLCNILTHDRIPWGSGGIHGSRIRANA